MVLECCILEEGDLKQAGGTIPTSVLVAIPCIYHGKSMWGVLVHSIHDIDHLTADNFKLQTLKIPIINK